MLKSIVEFFLGESIESRKKNLEKNEEKYQFYNEDRLVKELKNRVRINPNIIRDSKSLTIINKLKSEFGYSQEEINRIMKENR